MARVKKDIKARAALAKSNTVSVELTGSGADTNNKLNNLASSLGVVFDGNQNVVSNATNNNISTNASNIASSANNISLLQAKINAIATLLGITFDASGNITSEDYTTHTHEYDDGTINDTEDGTGTQTDTTRTTTGIV